MIAMNQEQFRNAALEGTQPVLIEFSAPWCGYCRRIAPALEKLSRQYTDRLTFGQINIDDESQLAEAEGIEVVPTLVLYQNGAVLGSIVAPESKARIEEFIEEYLG